MQRFFEDQLTIEKPEISALMAQAFTGVQRFVRGKLSPEDVEKFLLSALEAVAGKAEGGLISPAQIETAKKVMGLGMFALQNGKNFINEINELGQ